MVLILGWSDRGINKPAGKNLAHLLSLKIQKAVYNPPGVFMAEFVGTIEEFKRYLGPRVKNVVNGLTRDYRRDIGKCECEGCPGHQGPCSETTNLESAHVTGRDRPMIIADILKDDIHNSRIKIDLKQFELALKEKHYPLDECIRILCRKCHTEYDKQQPPTLDIEILDKVPESTNAEAEILEIRLVPQDPDDFRNALIKSRRAKITTFFSNGETTTSEWKAERITTKSNIFGNLRSRAEFRSGNWQERGITKVLVEVLERAEG
jgi:hypothetical protein